jgi:hypothetical protein
MTPLEEYLGFEMEDFEDYAISIYDHFNGDLDISVKFIFKRNRKNGYGKDYLDLPLDIERDTLYKYLNRNYFISIDILLNSSKLTNITDIVNDKYSSLLVRYKNRLIGKGLVFINQILDTNSVIEKPFCVALVFHKETPVNLIDDSYLTKSKIKTFEKFINKF